ncbi:rRNA adenine N(6)-methyltransferase family protein [Phytoactinopolyspora limicola]|uniref:rRNA adenine N(6)-methyltransferase family protein n=1 Tax=Phytoactinopolyspora limicola TaxID=2715536 RepID=UPI0014077989|nr:rRNA adenine N(6)-methyltransferase family protein [Phytoactinopolyspora limicola]
MSARTRTLSLPDNRSGIHLLNDRSVARRLIRSANVGVDDLVLEFGAGTGALTGPLSATGARVIAIERNPAFVTRLGRRFGDHNSVRVVAGDARVVPLPRRPYFVVANIPYSISTSLVRRLLTPDETFLRSADLLVEWGFAKRITATEPRDYEVAWWQLRFEMSIERRVAPTSFIPAPSVASAHVRIRRRRGLDRGTVHALRLELRRRYGVSRRRRR